AFNWTITIKNQGSAAPVSAPVNITDTFPGSFSIGAPTGTNWSCTVAAPSINCTYSAALGPAGVSTPLTVPTTPNASGIFPDTVTVNNAEDYDNTNNSATASVTVTDSPDISVSNSDIVPSGQFTVGIPGGTYTVGVRNVGLGPTTGTSTATITVP